MLVSGTPVGIVVILVVDGTDVPALGQRQGIFVVGGRGALDLSQIEDSIDLGGVISVFDEVAPGVAGMIEHDNGIVILGHQRIELAQGQGTAGQRGTVERVQVSVIAGTDIIGLFIAVKRGKFAGIVVRICVRLVNFLINGIGEGIGVIGDGKIIQPGDITRVGIGLLDRFLAIRVGGMGVNLALIEMHDRAVTAREGGLEHLDVTVGTRQREQYGMVTCLNGIVGQRDDALIPDGLGSHVDAADEQTGLGGIDRIRLKGISERGGIDILIIVILFGILLQHLGACPGGKAECVADNKVTVGHADRLEIVDRIQNGVGGSAAQRDSLAVQLDGIAVRKRCVGRANGNGIFRADGLTVRDDGQTRVGNKRVDVGSQALRCLLQLRIRRRIGNGADGILRLSGENDALGQDGRGRSSNRGCGIGERRFGDVGNVGLARLTGRQHQQRQQHCKDGYKAFLCNRHDLPPCTVSNLSIPLNEHGVNVFAKN